MARGGLHCFPAQLQRLHSIVIRQLAIAAFSFEACLASKLAVQRPPTKLVPRDEDVGPALGLRLKSGLVRVLGHLGLGILHNHNKGTQQR